MCTPTSTHNVQLISTRATLVEDKSRRILYLENQMFKRLYNAHVNHICNIYWEEQEA